jgi:hypothetical protein
VANVIVIDCSLQVDSVESEQEVDRVGVKVELYLMKAGRLFEG